jgi:hypothetical protein
MTTRRKALGFVTTGFLSALVAGKAQAQNVKCPVCDSDAYFTGDTRLDVSGKLLMKYQCMLFQQHVFWAVN